MSDDDYIMSESAEEHERLLSIEAEHDPATLATLERIGVRRGDMCLDVAAGRGSIARWLSDKVGLEGRVLATDLDPSSLLQLNLPNLEVRQHDILCDPLESSAFDLVHARFLLMHLREPKTALTRMVNALKPGGWILVEEPDFLGRAAVNPDSLSGRSIQRNWAASEAMLRAMGLHPYLGRQLPLLLSEAGLQEVRNEGSIRVVQGGSRTALRIRREASQFREFLFRTGLIDASEEDRFESAMGDTSVWFTDFIAMRAWGQRAA